MLSSKDGFRVNFPDVECTWQVLQNRVLTNTGTLAGLCPMPVGRIVKILGSVNVKVKWPMEAIAILIEPHGGYEWKEVFTTLTNESIYFVDWQG